MIRLASIKDKILARIAAMTAEEMNVHFKNAGCDVTITKKAAKSIRVVYGAEPVWAKAVKPNFRDCLNNSTSDGFVMPYNESDFDYIGIGARYVESLEQAANSNTLPLAA